MTEHNPFCKTESEVRYYSRKFPTRFSAAYFSTIKSTDGRSFIDFFAGASSLNMGHNHPTLIAAAIDYLRSGGVLNSLDMDTPVREKFISTFHQEILEPRGLRYLLQFVGPTGTNCVEASLRLAQRFTKRSRIIFLEGSFHGMTAGAAAVSSTIEAESSPRTDRVMLSWNGTDSLPDLVERLFLEDTPAAMIIENIQCESGIRAVPPQDLLKIRRLTKEHGVLLILDEIQIGCGRTGTYFSFESSGIKPDMICLSKSLSGLGLPFSLLLLAPDLDVWRPGEFSGTFRGNNLAMATGTTAIELWKSHETQELVADNIRWFSSLLKKLANQFPKCVEDVRCFGLLGGVSTPDQSIAAAIQHACFRNLLLVETCGVRGEVIKLLPPLTISKDERDLGEERLLYAIGTVGESRVCERV